MANPVPEMAALTVEEEKPLTLADIVERIKSGKAKRIIVMTGAGLSTAAGIPDFRTKGTGLYDNLQKYNLPHPTAVFELSYFMEKPEPFCQLARELVPEDGRYLPTLCHYFIALLERKGLLLRNFTQNIDTLERSAGISTDLLVEAHGSFHTASCTATHRPVDPKLTIEAILSGHVPRSPYKEGALVKPDIVFFGENLPVRFFELAKADFPKCDLLLVMGTSLQVQPFASLVREVPKTCPRVLINRDPVSAFGSPYDGGDKRDVSVLGTLDDEVLKFADLLGWREELLQLQAEHNARLRSGRPDGPPPPLPELTGADWSPKVIPPVGQAAPAAPAAPAAATAPPAAPPAPAPAEEPAVPSAPGGGASAADALTANQALILSIVNERLDHARILLAEGADPDTMVPGQSKVMEKRGDEIKQTESAASLLAIATMQGKLETVRLLLEFKAKANDPDEGGSTSLMLASQEGHHAIAEELLNHGADVNAADVGGGTALIRACEAGHSGIARLLLAKGADVNQKGIWVGGTPLYWAVISGDAELVGLLLEAGADPNVRNNANESPLGIAEAFGNTEVAELLRAKGATA